jgi:hypothetical protein
MVAAWIRADTGVGPSMASGSHACKPIWADLPMAPTNKKKQIHSKALKGTPKVIDSLIKKGTITNIVERSKVLKKKKVNSIPISKPKSPTRLKINAFRAALFACIRVNQKLISKYEHKPTPSQPKKICIKLSAVIKMNIKNVNKDKYDINLVIKGSCDM